jgi:hypothetical protein
MSKVKIQGNASGTGVVTLTAPNTNTDRTITLPDGDISLGVGIDDNATSTAITIDANESVGIDVIPSAWHSAIPGFQIGQSGASYSSSSSQLVAIANSYYSQTGSRYINSAASSYYSQNAGVHSFYNAPSGTADALVTYTERMRITSTGNVTVNTGNLVIGTSGKGIDFSANGNAGGMTSEVLDDYEEGTWTPVITGTNGNPTVTYHSNTNGQYTKVGNIVTFDGIIQWTAYSGGVSNSAMRLSLPFSSSSASPWASAISVTYHSLTEDGYGGYAAVGTAKAYIVNTTSNVEIKTDKAGGTGLIMYHGTMKVA